MVNQSGYDHHRVFRTVSTVRWVSLVAVLSRTLQPWVRQRGKKFDFVFSIKVCWNNEVPNIVIIFRANTVCYIRISNSDITVIQVTLYSELGRCVFGGYKTVSVVILFGVTYLNLVSILLKHTITQSLVIWNCFLFSLIQYTCFTASSLTMVLNKLLLFNKFLLWLLFKSTVLKAISQMSFCYVAMYHRSTQCLIPCYYFIQISYSFSVIWLPVIVLVGFLSKLVIFAFPMLIFFTLYPPTVI